MSERTLLTSTDVSGKRRIVLGIPYEFGYAVDESIWWAEPERKVFRDTPQPLPNVHPQKSIAIESAKNGTESFQLVVNGGRNGIDNLFVEVDGDLRGANNETIFGANTQVRYAHYHYVHTPTLKAPVAPYYNKTGYFPDALPPLETPVKVKPYENQPLWITIRVPENAVAGDYTGTVVITSDGAKTQVPFKLTVWNVSLPARNRLSTAYELSHSVVFYYHNATNADISIRREILEMYWDIYVANRISPFDWAPLDPISVTWNPTANPPNATLDVVEHEKEIDRVVAKYGSFTNLRFDPLGMRRISAGSVIGDGSIEGYAIGTPQHEAMFASYVSQVETFYRNKGILDNVYVYRFDEPTSNHFGFIAEDFARLQKYAPDLARMITAEPSDAFIAELDDKGTNIDIWCPNAPGFNTTEAQKRKELGEKFWWYTCVGSGESGKIFTAMDIPGTATRVWGWETFRNGIEGSLHWRTNYWNAPPFARNQNPYEDPMSYSESGKNWGNGDGRFIYPPLEAAVPGMNNGQPVMKPPVSSIRLEMLLAGFQDYEMLCMLHDKKATRPDLADQIDVLLAVPADITAGLADWTFDPAPINKHRRKIAAMLEQ